MILREMTYQGLRRFPVINDPGSHGEAAFFGDSGPDYLPVEKYLPDNGALSSAGKTHYLYITENKDTIGMVFEMCFQNT
jgi:hypothetical protein